MAHARSWSSLASKKQPLSLRRPRSAAISFCRSPASSRCPGSTGNVCKTYQTKTSSSRALLQTHKHKPKAHLARVSATLVRLVSARKPILPAVLLRTVEKMITSSSAPWNPSTVRTFTENDPSCIEYTCLPSFSSMAGPGPCRATPLPGGSPSSCQSTLRTSSADQLDVCTVCSRSREILEPRQIC
jgi:hypothetical protein